MYIGLILAAFTIIIGIVSYELTTGTIENKVGGFFSGFLASGFFGGVISILISFVVSATILDNGNGKLINTSTYQIVKADGQPTHAVLIKDKLCFIHTTKQENDKFKESLSHISIIPLKEGESNPYVITRTYSTIDQHWTYFNLENNKFEVHINQDQIKIMSDAEEKIEK